VATTKQLFVPPAVQITVTSMLDRLRSAEAWWTFMVGFGRLLSGATSYIYIAGPLSPANLHVHDTIFWLLFIAVSALGSGGVFRSAPPARQAHVVGWAAMLAAFFVAAGPDALAPHFERYALVLVAPTILTFVLLLGCATERWHLQRHVLTFGSTIALLCLVSFYANYIQVLARTGSESHRTFRTSSREPKAAALDWIRQRNPGPANCATTRIVAEDWWTFWPLRYLAYREPRLDVVMTSDEIVGQVLRNMDGCSYLVGFAGGPFEGLTAAGGLPLVREIFTDPLQRPILFVWTNRLAPAATPATN
jgi:hypothetical protein